MMSFKQSFDFDTNKRNRKKSNKYPTKYRLLLKSKNSLGPKDINSWCKKI